MPPKLAFEARTLYYSLPGKRVMGMKHFPLMCTYTKTDAHK